MRRVLLAFLLLGLVAAPALRTAPATAQTAAGIVAAVERLSPSVLAVVATYSDAPGDVATGTALAYRADGYVVAAADSLRDAARVEVVLPEGRRVQVDTGRHVWWDPYSELAVMYLPGVSLEAATLADSGLLQPGEVAVALSHPLGLRPGHAVSAGVVSGVDRRLGEGVPLIQIDAPLNPGSGGAPVGNQAGEVVGLVTGKEIEFGFESIGYAIPSNTVRAVADQLIAGGTLRRPLFGFYLSDSDGVAAGWPGAAGVEIGWVVPDSPAGKAGIPSWSTLKAVNGTPVGSLDEFYAVLEPVRAGDKVQLTVQPAEGPDRTFTVVTGSHPGLFDGAGPAGGWSGGEPALPEEAPGIWTELTEDELLEAEDFAWSYMLDSFEVFAGVYLHEAPGVRVLLETEFMRAAYAHYRQYRLPEWREDNIDQMVTRSRGRLYLRFTFDPGLVSAGATPAVTLRQGDRIIASGTLGPLAPGGGGIPAQPDAADPAGGQWPGYVWPVSSAGVNATEPLTVVIGPPSQPIATLTWDLTYIR